jgi:hypothetical protein
MWPATILIFAVFLLTPDMLRYLRHTYFPLASWRELLHTDLCVYVDMVRYVDAHLDHWSGHLCDCTEPVSLPPLPVTVLGVFGAAIVAEFLREVEARHGIGLYESVERGEGVYLVRCPLDPEARKRAGRVVSELHIVSVGGVPVAG